MNNKKGQKQISLAGVAKTSASHAEKPKKKKKPVRLGCALSVLLVLAILVTGGFLLFNQEEGPSLTAREMVEYTVTPDNISGKVSYFALGVTGEEATDRMDMTAVMCYDRKNKAISVVQMPVATYIGKDTGFAVSTLGDVWGKPQPELFCPTCRSRVKADEISENTHTTCGVKLETRTGSAYGDLIRVFNQQYGLPIDNYLVISRKGLALMIDLLGGMDIKLERKTTLAGKSYDKGVQTLSGEAAVYYATEYDYDGTPGSDVKRMQRQRVLFAGLLQRLGACDMDALYRSASGAISGVFGELMLSADPVRFNTTSFGKARLLDISEHSAEGMKLSKAIAQFAYQISRIPLEQVTFSVLPGESMKSGTARVYSVNRAQVIELLNAQMNPYELPLDAATVTAPQLKDAPAKSDATTVSLDTLVQPQSGTITTTTVATTTTTTLAGGATQP